MLPYIGEIAALTAALFWAIATWIYSHSSQRFGALALNVIKGVIAALLLSITLFISNPVQGVPIGDAWIWLIVSGIIGIAIGDTAYFAALKRMGPRKVLLMESLAPPLTGLMALLVLNQMLTLPAAVGMLITLLSVIYVLRLQGRDDQQVKASHNALIYGIIAAVCQAVGVLLSHYALVDADVAPLWGALIRLLAGTTVILLLMMMRREVKYSLISPLKKLSLRDTLVLIMAVTIGTYLATWLQQISLKHANPAIAQTLMATSPLFALPIAWLRGYRPNLKIVLGTLSAVLGIAMMLYH
jgi:drug/metabolite transporter (DMT)-like permease